MPTGKKVVGGTVVKHNGVDFHFTVESASEYNAAVELGEDIYVVLIRVGKTGAKEDFWVARALSEVAPLLQG
jgi:hypothetical protein